MNARELVRNRSLQDYEREAAELFDARQKGDRDSIRRIQAAHPRLRGLSDSEIVDAPFTEADARWSIAREYGFESWPVLAEHVDALQHEGSSIARFESAADAVVTGDVAALERLLRESPDLARARSTRLHHATLLHYIADNGLEPRRPPGRTLMYRQKPATSALAVTDLLLSAGAEVDAVAQIYGDRDTTLALVASSVPPARAGVQNALIERLLDAGAAIEGVPGGEPPLITAIANGCAEAAETLVARGARINLVAAAALGRLDVVRTLVESNDDAATVPGVPGDPKAQRELALIWACMFGRTRVAEFLLDKGVSPAAQDAQGQTPLHYAARPSRLDLVRLLLERKAPLEARNRYSGTVLAQAVWSAVRSARAPEFVPILEALLQAGASIDAVNFPTGNRHVDEVLERHGARKAPGSPTTRPAAS